MDRRFEDLTAHLLLDPSGKVAHGMDMVDRYVVAAERQHSLMLEAWRNGDYSRALVELHFLLIAVNRVRDGVSLAAMACGGQLSDHFQAFPLSDYKEARNHFEHLDDRLHISGRNAPMPIGEPGHRRTVHFGFEPETVSFRWSDRSIDISEKFMRDFVDWAREARAIVDRSI